MKSRAYSVRELSRKHGVGCAIKIPCTISVAAAARGDTRRLDFKWHLQVTIVLEERESSGGVTITTRSISIQTGARGDLQRLLRKVLQYCRCKGKIVQTSLSPNTPLLVSGRSLGVPGSMTGYLSELADSQKITRSKKLSACLEAVVLPYNGSSFTT